MYALISSNFSKSCAYKEIDRLKTKPSPTPTATLDAAACFLGRASANLPINFDVFAILSYLKTVILYYFATEITSTATASASSRASHGRPFQPVSTACWYA